MDCYDGLGFPLSSFVESVLCVWLESYSNQSGLLYCYVLRIPRPFQCCVTAFPLKL